MPLRFLVQIAGGSVRFGRPLSDEEAHDRGNQIYAPALGPKAARAPHRAPVAGQVGLCQRLDDGMVLTHQVRQRDRAQAISVGPARSVLL